MPRIHMIRRIKRKMIKTHNHCGTSECCGQCKTASYTAEALAIKIQQNSVGVKTSKPNLFKRLLRSCGIENWDWLRGMSVYIKNGQVYRKKRR